MPILKKIFFFSLFLFIFSLLLWGVYLLSFKKPSSTTTTENSKDILDLPQLTKSPSNIATISDEAVIAPTITPSGDAIKYYSRLTGRVYQIEFDGTNKLTVADKELVGLNDVFWSSDKSKVISQFTRPNNEVSFFYYDYTTNTGVPAKKNTDEIAWSQNGNKIFYKYYDQATKTRSLNISDPDGNNWKKLTDINYRNISIASIPKTGAVSFWNKPDSFTETIFESIPVVGGEKKTIFQGKFGADYLWSPDGDYVLISHSETKGGNKMQLGIMNFNGGEYRNLGLPTFVSKCVWSKDALNLYCSLPAGIPESAILPNEYIEKKFHTFDTFWKIDIKTGEKERIIDPEKIKDKFDATNLFLNSDESMLFFVNRGDGKIYRINL